MLFGRVTYSLPLDMENSVEQPVLNFLSHGVDVTFAGREEKALIILADMTHLFT